MKNTFISARLVSPTLIRISIFSDIPFEKFTPVLLCDSKPFSGLSLRRVNTFQSQAIVECGLKSPLELGHTYVLVTPTYGSVRLDLSEAIFFDGFDEAFTYNGDDLGCIYTKTKTSFRVWAPMASHAHLLLWKGNGEKRRFVMERGESGTYFFEVSGDLKGYEYLYSIGNNGLTFDVTDPYAKASTPNGASSVVVDFDSLKSPRLLKKRYQSHTEAVIYEGHVRDLTIEPNSDIENKGKFLGLSEEGRTTFKGHPAGLDYLKMLGITHVQLLPIYDYKTVNELEPDKSYNWGYDPAQYFVPEGSYASNVNDPLSRIKDCQKMVDALHKEGIGVVMDVVFNHVYESSMSVFERVVPGYYFRRTISGRLANTSGCGNDLASERPMVRKMIIDACLWWVKTYSLDGFRFDLMGIIDAETLEEIKTKVREINPSFLFYGEGWDMGGNVSKPLGKMSNYKLIPEYGFFNDFYRESAKRYFMQDGYALQDFKYGVSGSSLNFIHGAKFLTPSQSINYIECHDGKTYYDELTAKHPDMSHEKKMELLCAANCAVIFSIGVPFIHAGEEIGFSKRNEPNTYNKGDEYNAFSYSLLDENYLYSKKLAEAIAIRKSVPAFSLNDPKVIDVAFDLTDFDGISKLEILIKKYAGNHSSFIVYFNPTDSVAKDSKAAGLKRIFTSSLEEGQKDAILPRSVCVFGK